jgi:acetolactate synthase-1/2/3 large subunit
MAKMTGGEILVKCLEAQEVDRVFCVPGESYLAVLDGLHDSNIDVVTSRHEGGAAIMAEADGKMLGRPGICMVTRGPGATNAAAGVHIAKQDSTPMILFVGQIGRAMKGREAFQEVDYRQTFGDLAKWVEEIDDAARIPEVIAHAYHIAMSGRPGPVVLALPEDMLRDEVDVPVCPYIEVAEPAPSLKAAARFEELLRTAERPFIVAGGSRWTEQSVAQLKAFAHKHDIPVGCSFRRQQLFDHTDSHYAGDVGLGINPALKEQIEQSDCLILLGARFSENPSQNFTLLGMPNPGKTLIHIHPGAEELGRIYTPTLSINATPECFFDAVDRIDALPTADRGKKANAIYRAWTDAMPKTPGDVQMGGVMTYLREALSDDAIVCNGAGNYAIWLHRFWRFQRYGTQLAPTSGSMGYGVPASIAGKLRHPERDVVCFAGDGCFQMTGQEFAAAKQFGANIIVLVIDNGIYGTIRMHQENHYPERISATDLVNPDFAAWARAMGGHGETVEQTDQFPLAFERARESGKPAIIHIKTAAEAISPTTTISQLRGK